MRQWLRRPISWKYALTSARSSIVQESARTWPKLFVRIEILHELIDITQTLGTMVA